MLYLPYFFPLLLSTIKIKNCATGPVTVSRGTDHKMCEFLDDISLSDILFFIVYLHEPTHRSKVKKNMNQKDGQTASRNLTVASENLDTLRGLFASKISNHIVLGSSEKSHANKLRSTEVANAVSSALSDEALTSLSKNVARLQEILADIQQKKKPHSTKQEQKIETTTSTSSSLWKSFLWSVRLDLSENDILSVSEETFRQLTLLYSMSNRVEKNSSLVSEELFAIWMAAKHPVNKGPSISENEKDASEGTKYSPRSTMMGEIVQVSRDSDIKSKNNEPVASSTQDIQQIITSPKPAVDAKPPMAQTPRDTNNVKKEATMTNPPTIHAEPSAKDSPSPSVVKPPTIPASTLQDPIAIKPAATTETDQATRGRASSTLAERIAMLNNASNTAPRDRSASTSPRLVNGGGQVPQNLPVPPPAAKESDTAKTIAKPIDEAPREKFQGVLSKETNGNNSSTEVTDSSKNKLPTTEKREDGSVLDKTATSEALGLTTAIEAAEIQAAIQSKEDRSIPTETIFGHEATVNDALGLTKAIEEVTMEALDAGSAGPLHPEATNDTVLNVTVQSEKQEEPINHDVDTLPHQSLDEGKLPETSDASVQPPTLDCDQVVADTEQSGLVEPAPTTDDLVPTPQTNDRAVPLGNDDTIDKTTEGDAPTPRSSVISPTSLLSSHQPTEEVPNNQPEQSIHDDNVDISVGEVEVEERSSTNEAPHDTVIGEEDDIALTPAQHPLGGSSEPIENLSKSHSHSQSGSGSEAKGSDSFSDQDDHHVVSEIVGEPETENNHEADEHDEVVEREAIEEEVVEGDGTELVNQPKRTTSIKISHAPVFENDSEEDERAINNEKEAGEEFHDI